MNFGNNVFLLKKCVNKFKAPINLGAFLNLLDMYRLVRETNNMEMPRIVRLVIQKHRKFLFWSWWSENYIPGGKACYAFCGSEEYTAKNCLDILNGKREWITTEIIKT